MRPVAGIGIAAYGHRTAARHQVLIKPVLPELLAEHTLTVLRQSAELRARSAKARRRVPDLLARAQDARGALH